MVKQRSKRVRIVAVAGEDNCSLTGTSVEWRLLPSLRGQISWGVEGRVCQKSRAEQPDT